MANKSDELDYIADVMKAKKNESKNIIKMNKKKMSINYNDKKPYKISSNKVHKNITIDSELVKWLLDEGKKYNLNFSETINQILWYCYENNDNKNNDNKNNDNKNNDNKNNDNKKSGR